MSSWVLLLRAVNVGGNNRLAMSDLKVLLGKLGHTDVRTVLNSGNAVFSSGRRSAVALAEEIENGLRADCGVDVRAVVRTQAQLGVAVDGMPPEVSETSYPLVGVMFGTPTPGGVARMQAWDTSPDRWALGDGVVYLGFAQGVHTSKMTTARLEKALGVGVTARTPATLRKLLPPR